MAVAGEVSLGIPNYLFVWASLIGRMGSYMLFYFIKSYFSDEHEMDFDKYGILIKVKFR